MPLAKKINSDIRTELNIEKNYLLSELKNKKITDNGIRLGEIFPNIEEYIKNNLKETNILDLFFPSMREDSTINNKTTIDIFLKNFNDMKEANTKGADKYFHSLANCESAQRGKTTPAIVFSTLREISDTPKNLLKGHSLEESLIDSAEDMEANLYGINKGELYPKVNCKYLVKKYRPKGLDEKF